MPISQAEFARRRNVSRPRVNQWIKAGKIFGPALVDGGIDEEIACAQLKVKLDIDQRHSGNGLATNLEAASAPRDPEALPANTVADQIAAQRLELLTRQNREKGTEEAVRLGLLCETADARQATGKVVARVVSRIDGALPEFAAAIAAKFKLPQRDVLHELKSKWRQVRTDAAIESRERAEPLPETVGFDLVET